MGTFSGKEVKINENFDTYGKSLSFLAFSAFGYGSDRPGTLSYDAESSFLMNVCLK